MTLSIIERCHSGFVSSLYNLSPRQLFFRLRRVLESLRDELCTGRRLRGFPSPPYPPPYPRHPPNIRWGYFDGGSIGVPRCELESNGGSRKPPPYGGGGSSRAPTPTASRPLRSLICGRGTGGLGVARREPSREGWDPQRLSAYRGSPPRTGERWGFP